MLHILILESEAAKIVSC